MPTSEAAAARTTPDPTAASAAAEAATADAATAAPAAAAAPKTEEKKKKTFDAKSSEALNIFGIGISSNNNLDLLNLIVLACAGIMIKIFFQENYSKLGNIGPATTTIWGYGLTGLALSIMIFVAISYTNRDDNDILFGTSVSFYSSLGMITPIIVTLLVITYIIYLNIIFFTRINSNKVTPDYHTYSFMSSTLLLVQIVLISNYLLKTLKKTDPSDETTIELTQMLTYILSVVNIVFIVMIHISLVFFSTDETTISTI
jgi:hypothetical protein